MIQIVGARFEENEGGYDVARLAATAPSMLLPDASAWTDTAALEWGPERYRTRFQARWDDSALHIRFDAFDDSPWHTMTRRDEHLWEEEVVELFLDADGSGRNYAEIEINPANVVCDLKVETPWPSLRSLTDWDWAGLESSVEALKDAHGSTEGWSAVARLPWMGLRSLYPLSAGVSLPPRPGTAWRFNVFRIKRPGGPQAPAEGAIFAAFSKPAGPSFHDPAAFRALRLGGDPGA